MIVEFDFSEFQTADQGDTTHYGGVVKVKAGDVEKVVPANGTDREWNMSLDVEVAVEGLVGRLLTDEEAAKVEDLVGLQEDCLLTL